MKDKNILIYGTGISGVAAIKSLYEKGFNIFVYDDKKSIDDIENIKELKDVDYIFLQEFEKFDLKIIDIAVKSPSVKLDNLLLKKLEKFNIPIFSDIEMAYRLTNKDMILITGTNGKTTTTTLIHKVLKDCGKNPGLSGNIGSGILKDVFNPDHGLLVVEASSFQLASIDKLKPKISVIINIGPDHLDWHGNFQNYLDAKFNIAKNQDSSDYTVLNYDDENIKKNLGRINSNIIFFSYKEKLDQGVYVENDKIIYRNNKFKEEILNISDIKIPGTHNIENIMATIAVGKIMDIPTLCIKKSISNFRGVEHRLELVKSSLNKGVFYNDSKGTNPNSTMKAIEALEKDIILILGGYNKNSNFDELVKTFKNKVKYILVFGETKYIIERSLKKYNYTKYELVDTLEQAVKKGYNFALKEDKILLSPASASWDMYSSFEERGKDFKRIIKKLEKEYKDE